MMCAEDAKPGCGQAREELICSGIWGGIRNLDQEVQAGPLLASIYSSSSDGGKGGDIYYFGVCTGDTVARVAIADVMGHGQAVTDVSQYVYDALQAHMRDADSATILTEINEVAHKHGLKAMTTAAVVGYDANEGEFQVSSAGHPPVLFRRVAEGTWSVAASENDSDGGYGLAAGFPLAVAADSVYDQFVIPATSGDRLFVYTDGVTEAPDNEGKLFGMGQLREVLNASRDARLPELKLAVLRALQRHTDGELKHDDVTLIAMEVR